MRLVLLLVSGVVLTSCKTFMMSEDSFSGTPNDTVFITQAFEITKNGQQAAEIARLRSSDQNIRIYAEQVASFLQKTEKKLDSISGIKNITIYPVKVQDKIAELEAMDTDEFDFEFLDFMESHLNRQIEILENVSTQSEDNEISTLAIKLLPDIQNQLDTLITVRESSIFKF